MGKIIIKSTIDEAIWQSWGNVSLGENLCILEVPKIWARAEPEGYSLSFTFLLKKVFLFQLT